jgi:RimJ/RimL family protein N-acetyltransferase
VSSEPKDLRTERILLRRWRDSDRAPFAAMNADPRVMEHMPSLLTRDESDAMGARIARSFDEHGLGLWAVEVPRVAPFIGYVGLFIPTFDAPFMPCVEVGWRLAYAHWGSGYAREAARAAIADGFERLGLAEIVSFTVLANERSWKLMEKLGMRRSSEDDFDHPRLPPGHKLARHILYRVKREEWAGPLR